MTPPRFSIVTPVYETPTSVFRSMLRSVRNQSFGDWELCLVDDASSSPELRRLLDRAQAEEPRIKVAVRTENGGIVVASNDALTLSEGEFVALLDHDDRLHPDALALVDEELRRQPDVDYLYTDEDKIDAKGFHGSPFLKPEWSPERMRTQMYTCHLSVFRRTLIDEIGGFDAEYEGAQDWDLVLRATERARAVAHVPRVLYHWRSIATSAAAGQEVKPWAFEAGARAVQAHCDRIGLAARVERDGEDEGVYHLEPELRDSPLVSIVVPTRGTVREVRYEQTVLVNHCVRSIVESSTYENYEVVVVADADTPADTIAELEAIAPGRIELVEFDRPFNFSAKINAGAVRSRGEHLLLLNDDVEVATPNWIERMVMYSQLPEVGAVGGRLLLEDGRLQHAGVGFEGGLPGHPYHGFPGDGPGYANAVKIARNLLAVTGACLMTPKQLFEEVGGLSTVLPVNYNDVDYCLKLRASGKRVVYDPDLVMYHFESSSRSSTVDDWEKGFLRERWAGVTDPDPYSHPYLREGLPQLTSHFLWGIRRPPKLRRPSGRSAVSP